MAYLRNLREPYRTLFIFIIAILFGLLFNALLDLILPPHRVRWWHNFTLSIPVVVGVLMSSRYRSGSNKPKT